MADNAWVTLATNDSYALGAQVLGHSLKKVNTKHKLAVLVTPSVTDCMKEKLSKIFDLVQTVDVLDSKDAANLALLARPELGITFTKLHCWTLVQFKKCVFLDADTLVIQNSDELFDRDEFSAAPDVGWPDCFNSGVFVFKPSIETFNALLKLSTEQGSFDGGDQGLLNTYFSNWSLQDSSKRLPFIYNLCSIACYSYLPAFKQYGQHVRIFHFIGNNKPWLQHFDTVSCQVQTPASEPHLGVFLQFWWNIFFELVHPTLAQNMGGLAAVYSQLKLGVAQTDEQVALEEKLRKEAWEAGHVDYMGRDSFDNILQKISETLSLGKPDKKDVPPQDPKDVTSSEKPKVEDASKPDGAEAKPDLEEKYCEIKLAQPEIPTSSQTSELGPAVLVEKTPEIGPAVLVKKGKAETEKTLELGPGTISTVAICPNLTVAEIYNAPLLAASEPAKPNVQADVAPVDSNKPSTQPTELVAAEAKPAASEPAKPSVQADVAPADSNKPSTQPTEVVTAEAKPDAPPQEVPKTPGVIEATPPATPEAATEKKSKTDATSENAGTVCKNITEATQVPCALSAATQNLKIEADILDTPPVTSSGDDNKKQLPNVETISTQPEKQEIDQALHKKSETEPKSEINTQTIQGTLDASDEPKKIQETIHEEKSVDKTIAPGKTTEVISENSKASVPKPPQVSVVENVSKPTEITPEATTKPIESKQNTEKMTGVVLEPEVKLAKSDACVEPTTTPAKQEGSAASHPSTKDTANQEKSADACVKSETCPKSEISDKKDESVKAESCAESAKPEISTESKSSNTQASTKAEVCKKTEGCATPEACTKLTTEQAHVGAKPTDVKPDACFAPPVDKAQDKSTDIKPESCPKSVIEQPKNEEQPSKVCEKANLDQPKTEEKVVDTKVEKEASKPDTKPEAVCEIPSSTQPQPPSDTVAEPVKEIDSTLAAANVTQKDEVKQPITDDKNANKTEPAKDIKEATASQKPAGAAGQAKKKGPPAKGQGDKKEAGDGAQPSMPVPPPRKKDPKKVAAPKPAKPSKK
ncbi:titin isoform X3 [Ctenocephalides felis]|uniref:titin isoform X3 n=1 Tax=Ctenocephalides felis TaxID=7515 RepID=UPI000E6E3439|nr:titin isoform X3 [Ctenocephalides felis]